MASRNDVRYADAMLMIVCCLVERRCHFLGMLMFVLGGCEWSAVEKEFLDDEKCGKGGA